MTMPNYIAQAIKSDLGTDALAQILKAYELIECLEFILVRFWIFGHECEYYPGTEPLLLRQVETDKEFETFDQLLEEINGKPIHHTTVRA
jgi:hypothetical protein